jgi:hypothetical protein
VVALIVATGVEGRYCAECARMIAILRDIVPDARISAGGGETKHPGGGIDMPRKGALNSARAAAVFGYSPRYDLRAGLEVYIRDKRQALARERRHEG